jgi:hypothetical protein
MPQAGTGHAGGLRDASREVHSGVPLSRPRYRKTQFAVLAIVATRGGVEPDLLDEVAGGRATISGVRLAAAVAIIRSYAERVGEPVPTFVARLAEG